MTRKQEIAKAASDKYISNLEKRGAFMSGASWADKHQRNKWKRPEDEMPIINKDKEAEPKTTVVVFLTDGDVILKGYFDYNEKRWWTITEDCSSFDYITGHQPTHWAHIDDILPTHNPPSDSRLQTLFLYQERRVGVGVDEGCARIKKND